MSQQPSPQTERHASSRDARDVFLDALRQVCYLSPEQEQAIYKRMQDNNEFYVATGRDAAPFLEVVLQRHQEKHASLNICHYGNMRTGKSHASLFIASTFDPTFTVDHVVFDLAQMQILLPHTTSGSIYIVDDVRERYGLGSKSEVVNTQTFLETAAKSGTCLIFNSPTVKFTTGLKYFLEFLGYCDTFSLAIVYAKAIIFKNDRQVETLDPIGFIKFPKPTHLQPLLDAYEAKKDAFIAEIRKKAGGSGTNIIDARIDYIMAEVDFRQCTDLQDYQDEIILWDHTLPSNLVNAMARKIRRFLRKQEDQQQPQIEASLPIRAGEKTDTEYLRDLVRQVLKQGFRRRRRADRDAEYASCFLVPDSPLTSYPQAVNLYSMAIKKDQLMNLVAAARQVLTQETTGQLGEAYVFNSLCHYLPPSQRELLIRDGAPGAPDLTFHAAVHLNAKLLFTEEDGLTLDATPECRLPDAPEPPPRAPFGNKFGVVVRARACEVRVIPLKFGVDTFSMSAKFNVGGLEWLAGYLSEQFGGPDGG